MNPYQKILLLLQQKQIDPLAYQEYLYFQLQTSFPKITAQLSQQKMSLKKFYTHLTPTVFSETLDASAVELSKQIALKLLFESKITLVELNALLKKIPAPTPKYLLNTLLKEQKISIDEFLFLSQGKWEPYSTEQVPFQAQLQGLRLEFFAKTLFSQTKIRKKIGRYDLLEEVGKGATGIVYKAFHPQLQQFVALKILNTDTVFSEKKRQRFQREIQTMAKLSHQGLIRIFDSGEEENVPYLVMEWVSGLTLAQEGSKLSLRECIQVIQKVLNALEYAHQQGIIHRDLKLENILLNADREPKIGDFGLAKDILKPDWQKLTQSQVLLGTLHYFAPEQIREGSVQVDFRSDLYAIGVCLYYLLTGQYPHNAPQMQELFDKILKEEVLPPSKWNKAIRRELDWILLKALAKKPENRYSSAKEFAEDLNCFLMGRPIFAKSQTHFEPWKRWKKRHPFLFAFFLFFSATLIFLSSGLYLLWQGEQTQQFQEALQKAQQHWNPTKKISESFFSSTQKIEQLLNALRFINVALNYQPEHQQARQDKLVICQELLQLAQTENAFPLAYYILQEITSMGFFSPKELEEISQQLNQKRRALDQHQLKRLHNWSQDLKTLNLSIEQRKDAVFELSQLTSPLVFQELLRSLKEGTDYFLKEKTPNQNLDIFYETVVETLGRGNHWTAGSFLYEAFSQMGDKLIPVPMGKRSLREVNYMVLLMQALAHLKTTEYSERTQQIRLQMGENGVFWDRTIHTSVKLLEKLQLEITVKNFDFYVRQLRLSFLKMDHQATIEAADQLLKENPQYLEAYNARSSAKRALGNYEEALIDIEMALSIAYKSDDASYQTANLYNNRGILRQIREEWNLSIEDFTQALNHQPEFIEAYNNRAMSYYFLDQSQLALDDFEKAIQFNPHKSMIYGNRGLVLKKLGNLSGAIKDYNEAIRLNNRGAVHYMHRGMAKKELGDWEGALQDFNWAIHYKPGDPFHYRLRAALKESRKDDSGALADFTEAIRLAPKEARNSYKRGLFYFEREQHQKALADFSEAVKLDPKDADNFYYRARTWRRLQQETKAIEDFTEAIRLDSNNLEFWLHRGLAHKAILKLSEADFDFSEVIKKDPQHAEAYNFRGLTRQLLKDIHGAHNDFSEAIRISPEFSSVYINRGNLLFHARKNRIAACEDMAQYLKLTEQTNDPYVQRNRQEILNTFPELKK